MSKDKARRLFVSALSDVASICPAVEKDVYSVAVRCEDNPYEVLTVLDGLREHVEFRVLSVNVEFLGGAKKSKPGKKVAWSKIVQGDRPDLCFPDWGVYALDSDDCVVQFDGEFEVDFPYLQENDCGLYETEFSTKELRKVEKELTVLFKDNPGKKYAHIMTGYGSDYFKVVFSNKKTLQSVLEIDDYREFKYGVPDFSVPVGGRLIFNLNH